ncbi:hypothetical protein KO495_13250 [Colwellia sp. D2M02]|uniref:DUF6445 family protein n=1 Tax=Colwellia sp. D2M02 TaxID=2841562 RepID=UPI001C0A2848|nr:DUF6445 family protein [Colwellia sp. D2M02]MBU2894280.1 hypothetical protein [Colwellia sp. D2M02]
MKNLRVNPDYTLNKVTISDSDVSVLVIDNFLFNSDAIMHFAHNIAYFNPMFSDNTLFPGMRDKMPAPYTRLLKAFFDNILLKEIKPDAVYQSSLNKSLLSLVTCPPTDLSANQKMPHVDSCNDDDYAFVHYLSGQALGGTSFYRYKPKNLIAFTQQHQAVVPEMLEKVTQSPEEHASYITQSTSLFEQVLTIDAQPNRLIIYPANILHSANLVSNESYCGDINQGRLSISSFASITTK